MNIIFHYPLPLNSGARSASGIRPLRMLEAFQALGFQVDIVAGYSRERKRAIENIRRKVSEGVKYHFIYSESSTMPTTLTDPHHLPLHPFMDFLFFRFCNKSSIPIGLFYRDIYWRFEGYGKGLSPLKAVAAKAAYWFDLWIYQRTLKKLFLPSMEMGRYVPIVDKEKFEALPPGHQSAGRSKSHLIYSGSFVLKLFYVGGMSHHYQMHKLFEVVNDLPQIELTICTREEEWLSVKHEYPTPGVNVRVIHKTGGEMEVSLLECDIALLFVKPHQYWEFASPVKLYEYLGFEKPILATAGTLAAAFVKENNVGWSLNYDVAELKAFLQHILKHPEELQTLALHLAEVAHKHTWKSRAQQVMDGLIG